MVIVYEIGELVTSKKMDALRAVRRWLDEDHLVDTELTISIAEMTRADFEALDDFD